MKKMHMLGGALVIAVLLAAGCSKDDPPLREVSFETRQTMTVRTVERQGNALRIAVGGMITTKEGFGYYRQFLDYISEQMNMKVEYVDREDYAEINKLIKQKNVDAGFVCAGPYVDGHREFGMELLAAPQAYGKTVYYSYIIVPKNSPVKNFDDLRGKRFAFTDPLSNTGSLVPTYMLAQIGETPDSFFETVIYTMSHDKSIKTVAANLIDGAAVDSLIFEYLKKTQPDLTERTRVIRISAPYGIPPFVVHPGLDSVTKKRLREVLLTAHENEKGAALLKGMMIDRFVPVRDSHYNSIRDMKRWLEKREHS